ncbi:MAG: BatD family protein [Verrucomicrobiae bacterium]|nr:BatD family protein [Verrucomicrobiae bacterium]
MRGYNKIRRFSWMLLALILAVFLPACFVYGASVSLNATIEPPSITVGETATLSLSFEGGKPDGDIQIPSVPGLTINPGGESFRQYIVNNRISISYVRTFAISAEKEGEYTIPPFVAAIGGQKVASQPIKLIVGKVDNRDIERFARLRFNISKGEVRVGEPFQIEVRLLYLALNGGEQPQIVAEGFNIGKLVQNDSHSIEEGRTWRLITFRTYATAMRAGELSLGPVSMKVTIPSRLERNFFGETVVAAWRTVALTAPEYKIKVLPLPSTNVPTEFNGAIGVYNMTVNISPTNVAVGDPITVKVTISGRGPIESLTLPEQPAWSEFKVYPPTSKVEITDQFGLAGTKTFEQVVVAKSTETRELPPFIFAYFDTEKQEYRILKGPNVPLIVRPSASGQVVMNTTTNASSAIIQTDIVPNKVKPGAFGAITVPIIVNPYFWGAQTLPAAMWLVLLVRRKRLEELTNNPRLRRKLETERIIKEELKKLPALAEQQKTEEFFAAIFRLLQEKIGERLDLPALSITESVIDENLVPIGCSEELIFILRKLFNECNQARYGGQKNTQQLNQIIPEVHQALKLLSEVETEK